MIIIVVIMIIIMIMMTIITIVLLIILFIIIVIVIAGGMLEHASPGRPALVEAELTEAHREAAGAAEAALLGRALFGEEPELAALARRLRGELDEGLPRLARENAQLNERQLNGFAGAAVASAFVSILVPPLAPRLAAVSLPVGALQLWEMTKRGTDVVSNSIELHKEMLRTERTWAGQAQAALLGAISGNGPTPGEGGGEGAEEIAAATAAPAPPPRMAGMASPPDAAAEATRGAADAAAAGAVMVLDIGLHALQGMALAAKAASDQMRESHPAARRDEEVGGA